MAQYDMRDDGLYVFEEHPGGERDDGERDERHSVKISGRFETPACVSDPKSGNMYALWVTFTDEQGRTKARVITAAALQGNAREICAALSDQGLYIDRKHQNDLVDYLLSEMQYAPSADLATTPGWVTPTVFALPDAIFGEQTSGRRVYFGGDQQGHMYRTSGSLEDWQTEVASPCEGNSRAITSICAGLASPLMQDVGETSGGFHFYGPTSTGKTTLLLCGGSVCGGGDRRTGFVSSWRTTTNGLEPLLSSHNDGTLFLDEIGQADAHTITELIYTAANSSGKHRMTRELQAAPRLHWRALIVSSGEHTLESYAKRAGGARSPFPGGAAVRIIDIPADAGVGFGVFEDLHGSPSPREFADKLRAASLRYYGVALRQFLEHLTAFSPEERREIVLSHCDQFRAVCHLDGASPEVLRAANRMAVIAAAGELAIDLGVLPWPPGTAIEGVATCFNAWREARGGDNVHDDEQMVAQVRLFVEQYRYTRFAPIAPPPGPDGKPVVLRTGVDSDALKSPEVIQDLAGWRRRRGKDAGEEFLVQRESFKKICQGYDPAAVARALHGRGYLERQGNHWKIRTTIGGQKKDVYCVLDSILSAGEESE